MTKRVPPSLRVDGAEGANRAIAIFPRHYKLLSWLYLVQLGVPTLRGLIISAWDDETSAYVSEFALALGRKSLLLRSDRSDETGTYPRGGYLVPLDRLEAEVRWFLDQDRTVFLLEPRSPFDDLYSFSARFGVDTVVVEVVGPGFDASDLKRGDTSPHEVIELARQGSGDSLTVTERTTITTAEYRAAWERRLRKVGRMTIARDTAASDDEAEAKAREVLIARGETLLLRHESDYVPIPENLLGPALASAELAAVELRRRTGSEEQVFSASFLGSSAQLVFWDVVWPTHKFCLPAAVRPPSPGGHDEFEQQRLLKGLAASPGRYRGRARVVAGPHEYSRVERDDVLVSPTTTPDIVLVLYKVGAIVTDHGGRLSHAAVVAREAGIPAVVGTGVATREITDGALILVDGTRGLVRL